MPCMQLTAWLTVARQCARVPINQAFHLHPEVRLLLRARLPAFQATALSAKHHGPDHAPVGHVALPARRDRRVRRR